MSISPPFVPRRQSPDQMTARASLLSGLRTGPPRSVSPNPVEYEATQYDSTAPRSPPTQTYSPETLSRRLKANAAVFTPSGPQTPPLGYNQAETQHSNNGGNDNSKSLAALQEQLAALHMQALASQNQTNLANYGISRGQPHYTDPAAEQALAMAHQQQQQMQLQLAMMQLQAQHQQHQQQQHVAQQQMLLAHLHAEYIQSEQNRRGEDQMSSLDAATSAQEQRQAAQASIQASLRNRQAEQHYALLMQQQALLQAQAAASNASVPLDQRGWRSSSGAHTRTQTPPSVRADSPAQNSTKPVASDAASWRTKTKTPSIVIDDSASEGTESKEGSDVETPETSEEDVDVAPKVVVNRFAPLSGGVSLGRGTPPPTGVSTSIASRLQGGATPRAISLASAPRNRAFADGARAVSDAPSTTVHPQRQPRGPPSDVKPTNFSARQSQRTRRDALSKLNALCKSPRTVAAFRATPSPAVA